MEIWATLKSFLPCWSSQRWRALMCVGLKTLLCPPSVVPITVMSPTGDTVKTETPTRTTFSRTHVYLMTLWCDIWGTAELQANNILISFFGLNVFSGACSWWRHLTRLLNYSGTVNERETPRRIYWGLEKSWKQRGLWMRKKWEINAYTHYTRRYTNTDTHIDTHTDTHTEVLPAHVWSKDSGVPWDCIIQDDLQPLSDTMK